MPEERQSADDVAGFPRYPGLLGAFRRARLERQEAEQHAESVATYSVVISCRVEAATAQEAVAVVGRYVGKKLNPLCWRLEAATRLIDGPEAHQHTMVTDDDGHQWCVNCDAQFDGEEHG